MSITYSSLQTAFAAVNAAVTAEVGTAPLYSYGNEIQAAEFKAPHAITIKPISYRYDSSVGARGGKNLLARQIHKFTADIWSLNEDTTWALEGALARALKAQTWTNCHLVGGQWEPASNAHLGRILRLTFELETPLEATPSDTAIISTALTTAETE